MIFSLTVSRSLAIVNFAQLAETSLLCLLCCVKPKFHLARQVTTRHDTLSSPRILAQGKVVTCCVATVGQHGATRSSRQAQPCYIDFNCYLLVLISRQARLARHVFRGDATAWTGVDMSTSLFQKLFLTLMQIQSTKDYCFFVVRHVGTSTARHARQARHARHNALDTSSDTCRVMARRNKWNLGFSNAWPCPSQVLLHVTHSNPTLSSGSFNRKLIKTELKFAS